MIGQEHISRLTSENSGVSIVALNDYVTEAAEDTAEKFNLTAKIYETDTELVNDSNVDIVLVTSIGSAHKDTVMKAIKAGKYVFVEKPLATTAEDSLEIVKAEQEYGKRLVQVGFMRRYDPGYLQMKEAIDSGFIGEPLYVKAAHRNQTVDESYHSPDAIHDTFIHEIDTLHWLIDDDYESISVTFPKKTKYSHEKLNDPQLITLTTKSGIVIQTEVFVNCQFGYDIQCEVVGEEGIIKLPEVPTIEYRKEGVLGQQLYNDWKLRFKDAFRLELQEFIDAINKNGQPTGPSSWDGYIASVTGDAGVKAQNSGKVEPIDLPEKPKFYN